MHSLTTKKWAVPVAFAVSLFAMLILFICLPHTALAQAGTLGDEAPVVECSYTNSDGVIVDGSSLTAGTYDVAFTVKGMSAISVAQVTVAYTDVATVNQTPVYLISDADTGFASEGTVTGDGSIVFGFVSNNSDTTEVDPDGTVLAVFSVTFASDCSAEDVFTVSDNPNLTFILADYADGYNDEYALVDEFTGYTGDLHLMTFNVSPEVVTGHTVSGNVTIISESDGSSTGQNAYGTFTITLYSDSSRTEESLIKSVSSVCERVNNTTTNVFTIDELTAGTYYATATGTYALERNFTIVVGDEDISDAVLPMIVCDFNQDNYIGVDDAKEAFVVSTIGAASPKYVYAELNNDSFVGIDDAKIVFAIASNSSYSPYTIGESN